MKQRGQSPCLRVSRCKQDKIVKNMHILVLALLDTSSTPRKFRHGPAKNLIRGITIPGKLVRPTIVFLKFGPHVE